MYGELYHEIGDILVSLGLFNEKTDTAAMVVEVLKTALTLLLMPIKAGVQAAKGMVDIFIDWYNKSELLRGVLGGLGAVVVSLFTTIKDDAIKILGGVGDILVGIFTFDKDKIVAGFKSALSASADVMLEGGNKAADAFMKGYQANKNNRITRTVRVDTEEVAGKEELGKGAGAETPAGESDKDRKAREAKEKAAREKAAAEALKMRLAEIDAEKLHQEMLAQVRQAATAARGDELVTETSRIYTEGQLKIVAMQATAKKEIAQLTGSAEQKKARMLDIEKKLAAEIELLRADVAQKQGEATDKDNAEKYKQKQEDVDRLVELEEQGAARKQEALEEPFHASLKLQRELDEKRYEIRQAAFERELALIEASLGKESVKYKSAFAAQEKDQKAHSKVKRTYDELDFKAKQSLFKLEMQTAADVLSFGLGILEQDKEARLKHHALYVALAAAKVIVDGITEVQKIWEYSADFGLAGTIIAGVQTALAVARTTIALTKLSKPSEGGAGFAKGGATGTGAGLAVSPMGQLMMMSGMSVGGDGRLQDGSGFAVAGVVHEDEYVVPKWQLQDPQTAAVVQWLEARRMRGFADGGPTTGSGAQLPVAAASPSTDGEMLYAVLAQLLDQAKATNAALVDVANWPKVLQVVNSLQNTQAGLDELKQVKYNSAIRSK